MGDLPHKVALTFDDGPDPQWTPKILNILKAKGVPACFFVIGESANQETGLIKQEFALGNEVGNHTFTHPDFESIAKPQLQIELNLTELLIESSLGVKTLLFRPPFGIDHQPETASEIQMLPDPSIDGIHHHRRASRSRTIGANRMAARLLRPIRSCSACSPTLPMRRATSF